MGTILAEIRGLYTSDLDHVDCNSVVEDDGVEKKQSHSPSGALFLRSTVLIAY
jgi:hypothetical protein